MFLKSLTLKGFKSFAETSTLEFEPGVTVVVGPNGSGKSNIVDAVAWVLGAQGPRALRSTKMEDVIFAGTSRRAALGRAEVSLTIDNSAGLLPIDYTEVRVTRVLWRSGESEYSINGDPCRLLDVQELLSDTGVGRQQHTIISQQQLDTILSARPEERRAVIEEAAGISKHRRRKEKAQRRLDSTEGALLRAQDLLKEVRRQLRPLERQAEAARRHAGVTAELHGLRRHLLGRDLAVLTSRLAAGAAERSELARSEAVALASLARLDAAVAEAEAALDTAHDDAGQADLAELVPAAEGLRARAAGLAALLQERARRVQQDRSAMVDRDVVATLEAESSALADDLAATEAEAAELLPLEAEVAGAEEAMAQAAAEVEARFGSGRDAPPPPPLSGTDGGAGPAKRAGEVAAELEALRRAGERLGTELRDLDARAEALQAREARLAAESEEAHARREQCEGRQETLVAVAEQASTRLTQGEVVLDAAEEARRAADAGRHRWSARAEALAQALDEARARAGARRLAGVEGLLGALLEHVHVDEGWEAAFEAAATDALSAVLVEGERAARDALARLAADGAPGAVIPLSVPRPGAPGPAALPVGVQWLRPHVSAAHEAVSCLLDDLLRAAVIADGGWPDAADLALARPELLVLTLAGDRFAGGIWRARAAGAGVTGAALEEAREALRVATTAAAAALAAEGAAKADLARAQAEAAEARRVSTDNTSAMRAAAAAERRAGLDLAEARAEAGQLARRRSELLQRSSFDAARAAELEALLPGLESAIREDNLRAAHERAARAHLAEQAAAVATLRRELEVRVTAVEERRALLSRRRAEVEQRLDSNRAERERATERRSQLDLVAKAVARLGALVQARLAVIESTLQRLRERRRAQTEALRLASDTLEALRRERAGTERELAAQRERISRAAVEHAQLQGRLEALTETARRELDCEPESLLGAECPELPPGTSPANRARELERELRLMGPINPLALEEYAALEERHRFLEGQLHDVTQARRELTKVIRAVDAEIVTIFNAAFADVAENFSQLVATLFPGGHGSLYLNDPANTLESGVELEVRPIGKNIKRLSLLSGGERSLVALAFLFAVFRSRPSPFYMMDEVEAALDDVNLHRFLDLVHEFRDEAQLLIVSHQKRTMEAADCLYGVSMPPGGSSIVVSQKIPHDDAGRAIVVG